MADEWDRKSQRKGRQPRSILPPMGQGRERRTLKIVARATPTEQHRLRAVAEHFETTRSNVVCSLITQAWAALPSKSGESPAMKARPKEADRAE